MQGQILRGLETPGTTDAPAVSCPICGLVIEGLTARAPGKRTLQPCGHDAGFLRASTMYDRDSPTTEEHSLRTDGRGAPLTHEKPQRQADRANSHFCEAIGSRVYCLEAECGHCGDEDGEER